MVRTIEPRWNVMNIQLIGTGDIANSFYAPSLKKLQEEGLVDEVQVYDINKEKAEAFALAHGFAHGGRFDKADAFLVTTAYTATKDVVLELAPLGLPIMMEKPPATSYENAVEMVDALEKHGVIHQVAFNRHYMPVTTRLVGEIGELPGGARIINTTMNRFQRKETTFHTTAIHDIELVSFLAGCGFSSAHVTYNSHDTSFIISYVMKNGTMASSLFLTNSGMVRECVDVTQEDWTFHASLPMYDTVDGNGKLETYTANKLASSFSWPDGPAYMANGIYWEVKAFIGAVCDGRQPAETLESALDSIRIMEALRDRKEVVDL